MKRGERGGTRARESNLSVCDENWALNFNSAVNFSMPRRSLRFGVIEILLRDGFLCAAREGLFLR